MRNIFIFYFVLIKIIISNPSCESYINHCFKCNPKTNLCDKCEQPDVLIPDLIGGCIGKQKCQAGKNYCLECQFDEKLCKTCDEGYFPDENGGCSYSNYCKISYRGECIECKSKYILIGQKFDLKICKSIYSKDFTNCKKIEKENGFCQECEEGYFLNKKDKKCSKIENCNESIFGNCISCVNGYYFDKIENICKKQENNFFYCKQTVDGKNCDICQDDMYFDENGKCTLSNFCSESINGTCVKCINGFYLTPNSFCSDSNNCIYADRENGICFSCNDNYYLDKKDFKCKSNINHPEFQYCKKVENDLCVNCEMKYSLDEESKCCNTNKCAHSINGICVKCSEGYYLGQDNYCSNIKYCIKSQFGQCVECENEFYYNIANEQCLEAIDNFYGCKRSNDDGYLCSECKKGFYLRRNDSLCFNNTDINDNFYKCKFTDYHGENCTKCVEGYYLNSEDSKCTLIENCALSESENKCIECNNGYCLDEKNGKCINNEKISDINDKFYFACKRINEDGTKCEECIEGYNLNEEGFCDGFDSCELQQNGICVKCKQSLFEEYYCSNTIFGCIKNSNKNCIRCDNIKDFNICTECKEGYTITLDGRCQK